MPDSQSPYQILQNHTESLLKTFSLAAGGFHCPGYSQLEEMTEGLEKLGAKYMPDRDRPKSVKNKRELLGAMFYQYFINHPASGMVANPVHYSFVCDTLGINHSHIPDAFSVAICCAAYGKYLMSTYVNNLQNTGFSEINQEIAPILSFLDGVVTAHKTSYLDISYQIQFVGFIQSVQKMLHNFYAEADHFILTLKPLIEQQVKNNLTLDYFDMLACVKKVKASKLMHHMMEEYFIPNHADLDSWQYLIRYQLELCSQFALTGAYLLVFEQVKLQSNTAVLTATLNQVFQAIEYDEVTEKSPSLDLFATFVYMSAQINLFTTPWGTYESFVSALAKQCMEQGAGLRNFRYKELVKTEAHALYDFVHSIVHSWDIAIPPFAFFNNGRYIGTNKFHALLQCLRNCDEPLVRLIEGLLVEGRIPVISDMTDEPDKYWEKRTHDAINLYGEAAKDKSLRPMVDYLLWEIKNETEFPSVQKRLARYDISPSWRYFASNPFADKQQTLLPPIKGLLFFKPKPLPVSEEVVPVCSSSTHP